MSHNPEQGLRKLRQTDDLDKTVQDILTNK